VLDTPPAEQLALVEMFIANNVRTAMKATIRTKKAREEKTGEPATKGRGWKPKKLVAVAAAIKAALPPRVDAAQVRAAGAEALEEAAEARVKDLEREVDSVNRMLYNEREHSAGLIRALVRERDLADQGGEGLE
jgi:hypothetical protein